MSNTSPTRKRVTDRNVAKIDYLRDCLPHACVNHLLAQRVCIARHTWVNPLLAQRACIASLYCILLWRMR